MTPMGSEHSATTSRKSGVVGGGGAKYGAFGGTCEPGAASAPPSDPDLQFVIAVWTTLPAAARAGLVALIRAASIHKEVQS